MTEKVAQSSTAGVGKRFAALKEVFQRATGAGFAETSAQVKPDCS